MWPGCRENIQLWIFRGYDFSPVQLSPPLILQSYRSGDAGHSIQPDVVDVPNQARAIHRHIVDVVNVQRLGSHITVSVVECDGAVFAKVGFCLGYKHLAASIGR